MDPVKAPCHHRRAKHDSGPRSLSKIRWAVIHSAESTSAAGVAGYFATTAQASTQLAADQHECWRMLPDSVIPWGATGANTNGLHIEICGYAKWTAAQWKDRAPMLDRAAFKVAKWCHRYGIPARWVGPIGLRLRRKGLTTHVDVNKAFGGGTHWDPGPGFPKDYFLARVKHHLGGMG